jgi:hypothetical protein
MNCEHTEIDPLTLRLLSAKDIGLEWTGIIGEALECNTSGVYMEG